MVAYGRREGRTTLLKGLYMELASSEMIRVLLDSATTAAPRRNSTRNNPRRIICAAKAPRATQRKVRCTCGHCKQCVEDARWDKIFADKFEDPDYYSRPALHITSPLESF